MEEHHDDGGHALRDAQEITSSPFPLVRARDLCFRKMQIVLVVKEPPFDLV